MPVQIFACSNEEICMFAVLAAAALASPVPYPAWRIYRAAPSSRRAGRRQIVNFDLLLHNDGQKPLRLAAIHEQLFDKSGGLEAQRELNGNGKPSALAGLGDTVVNPGETKDIFQPFDRYDGDADLSRIHLTLVFLKAETPVPPVALTGDFIAQIDVHPLAARTSGGLLLAAGQHIVGA